MFLFVLGIIATIVLFFVLGIEFTDEAVEFHFRGRQVFSLFGLLICLLGCVRTVPTGCTGILTTFGRVESQTLDAGMHFVQPWVKVVKMDNRVQKAQVDLNCFSSDIQEVTLTYTVNYQINKKNAQDIYRTIGSNYYDTVIVPRVQEAVKAGFAKYTANELIEDRNKVASLIEENLIDDLAGYNIELVATAIENIDFSDEFTNAAEAKVTAAQNKLTAKTEQERLNLEAEAEAKRKVTAAQAEADSAIVAAKADAEVAQIQADSAEYQGKKDAAIMSSVGSQLDAHPQLIQYYYVKGWNGKLPETMLSDKINTLFQLSQ